MILFEQTLISEDLFEKKFICDISRCKGACCIEGDYGAPLAKSEIAEIESELPNIKPFLSSESIAHIDEFGIWEKDKDGDIVTTCLPDGACSFALVESDGTLTCGMEKAWNAGKTQFRKPVSCHLYPIRISRVGDYDALNYHRWDICKPACKLGDKHQVTVFEFLKEALIRTYGESWYTNVSDLAKQLK